MTESLPIQGGLRILHLEDNPDDSVLVLNILRDAGLSVEFQRVSSRGEFEAALESERPDLVLADFTLPGYDGAVALATARKIRPETPFIFVSGTIGEERAVTSLKNGATDYVLKGHLDRLVPAVQRALREAGRRRQHQRAEEALRQSEQRFREMADNIREVFWSASPDGRRLLYVSPAYEQVWQRPPSGAQTQPGGLIETVLAEDQPRLVSAFAQAGCGTPFTIEYRITRPDGAIRWIEDRGYPVNNLLGKVERVVGVAIDVTERKELQGQLQQAQKMEAIGQLAGGIAHDFNNMLTVINGRARLLLDTEGVPRPVAESIREIFSAGERAARLTRQLLVFSRKQFMHSQAVDLNETTADVARMLRSMIGEHIVFELDLTPGAPVVSADASMLEQVLMNLAVNGRDAMPRGGRLTLRTSIEDITASDRHRHRESTPGRYVCLQVRDTGSGIPVEILPRIFEPFFTTKPAGKGTGLGLSTVFGIVKHHQGWVEVESAVGKGTTFKVYLPLAEVAPVVAEPVAVEPKVLPGKETILLVEDEAPVREFASAVMSHYGYRVLQAASGVEAMEVWRWHSARIALLLTDLVMPDELSGMDLARQLQAERPELKVIFVSGYSPDASGPAFSSLKGMNFLHKPYPPRALAQMVREVLDHGRAVTAL